MNVTNVTTKNNFFIFSVIFIYIVGVFKKIGDIGDKCIKACKIKGLTYSIQLKIVVTIFVTFGDISFISLLFQV